MTLTTMHYKGETAKAANDVREMAADHTSGKWRVYLERKIDELKEHLVMADDKNSVASQIRMLREILNDVDPNNLHRRTPPRMGGIIGD